MKSTCSMQQATNAKYKVLDLKLSDKRPSGRLNVDETIILKCRLRFLVRVRTLKTRHNRRKYSLNIHLYENLKHQQEMSRKNRKRMRTVRFEFSLTDGAEQQQVAYHCESCKKLRFFLSPRYRLKSAHGVPGD